MNFTITLYSAVLFFILTPSIFFRIPVKGSTKIVTLVHAVIFGFVLYFTRKSVWNASSILENFDSSSIDQQIRDIDSKISQKKSACGEVQGLENQKKTLIEAKQHQEAQNQAQKAMQDQQNQMMRYQNKNRFR